MKVKIDKIDFSDLTITQEEFDDAYEFMAKAITDDWFNPKTNPHLDETFEDWAGDILEDALLSFLAGLDIDIKGEE